jgi:hypothetical protein
LPRRAFKTTAAEKYSAPMAALNILENQAAVLSVNKRPAAFIPPDKRFAILNCRAVLSRCYYNTSACQLQGFYNFESPNFIQQKKGV